MDNSNVLIWALVIGALVLASALAGARPKPPPAKQLKTKFAAAGVLRGRTKDDIVAAVGSPTSQTAMAGGKTLLQWMQTSAGGAYHIGVLFGPDGVCEGVTHEHDGTK